MTLSQAIKVLEKHNQWRKGADIPPTHPAELTEALDIALHQLKQLQRTEDDGK